MFGSVKNVQKRGMWRLGMADGKEGICLQFDFVLGWEITGYI